MLKIRLMKPGKSVKKRHHFKIVVIESKKARDSRFVVQIGFYDPIRKLLNINLKEYEEWLKKGAKPTETAASLAKRYKKSQEKVESSD